jgi:biopolymer transport protein ExbB/TolQ
MLDLLPLLSQALLWPVLILLLLGVALAIVMAGGLLGELVQRKRWQRANQNTVGRLAADRNSKPNHAEVTTCLLQRGFDCARLGDAPDLDKLLDDYQLRIQRQLSRVNLYVRIGPMLGLAGTLIPLGPGLMALSTGDVDSLSNQLVIAFTSTVLGLFVGATCFAIHLVRRHWYAQDLADLEFVLQRWQA